MNPEYPVYVISKGRYATPLTSNALRKLRVPHSVVVEPQEASCYRAALPWAQILELPFSNLGQGSIPARNWVWEDSISKGAKRHWILDDNIAGFYRLNRNMHHPVSTGTCFRVIEQFVDRYENIGMAGMHYRWLCKAVQRLPAFYLNTRIYSCILLDNSLTHRWRGRYNEDTDLSLRILKDGMCTALFAAFTCEKQTTMTMKGGNSDELYKGDGRLKMAESLRDQHPDVVKVTEKWGRYQHHVNYKPFLRNQLIRKPNIVIPEGINNYGMKLVERT